jgi:methylglutaconyl-CoA hydratase
MEAYPTLSLETDRRGVAYVTLNRPEKRNALSAQMIDDLTVVARNLGGQDHVRAVILSGAGPVFCAGADLDWMKTQIEASRTERMNAARKLAIMLKTLNELPKPLIGRIHGGAFGGGVGLACVCDVAVAAKGTTFGLTETRLGLIPATISPYVLARIGEGAARRVFMSARVFNAAEARDLGLVANVVDDVDLDTCIQAEIAPYLSAAPSAVAAAKALFRALSSQIDDVVIENSIRQLADIWDGEEASHGISAFLSKTPPRWI